MTDEPEVKTESVKPDVEPVADPEPTQPEVEPKAEPEPKVDPEPGAEPEPKAEPKAEPEPEPDPEPEVEPKAEDNVKKIEEQLSVITEVRQELANSFKMQKVNNKTIEQLQSQVKSLETNFKGSTKTIEKLTNVLDGYKAREEEANSIAYNKRLEQLSSNFSELGQVKTIEQLRELSEDVITEFESVTSMALNHKSEEKLDVATIPTQAIAQHTVVQKVPEQLSDKDFMKGVLNTLARQQNMQGPEGKRIIQM